MSQASEPPATMINVRPTTDEKGEPILLAESETGIRMSITRGLARDQFTLTYDANRDGIRDITVIAQENGFGFQLARQESGLIRNQAIDPITAREIARAGKALLDRTVFPSDEFEQSANSILRDAEHGTREKPKLGKKKR